MVKIAINTIGKELEITSKFCRENNIGIEVTDFAYPKNLDNNYEQNVQKHLECLSGNHLTLFHGPFLDLIATSVDQEIVKVSKQRHEQALKACLCIGAKYYIAHTNFNPLIKYPSRQKHFINQCLDFWLPIADLYGKHDIKICLENLWEDSPELQYELISKGNHPYLKASFDNGHALVFSKISSYNWINTLGSSLAHCHLHDNSGILDEHKSIGEGIENWERLFSAIKEISHECVIVAESDDFHKNIISLNKMYEYLNLTTPDFVR